MKLESRTTQVINDGIKGQVTEKINIEIRQVAIHNNAQMEYGGQLVTGVTTIVPEFYIEVDENRDGNKERVPITQGVPNVLNFPSSVIDGWATTETNGVTLPTEWARRESLTLLYVLRRILSRESQTPLFGISQINDWNVVTN